MKLLFLETTITGDAKVDQVKRTWRKLGPLLKVGEEIRMTVDDISEAKLVKSSAERLPRPL